MGLRLGFRSLWQSKAQGLEFLAGHTQAVMEDSAQFGAVLPLAYVADDGIQKFLLGL